MRCFLHVLAGIGIVGAFVISITAFAAAMMASCIFIAHQLALPDWSAPLVGIVILVIVVGAAVGRTLCKSESAS